MEAIDISKTKLYITELLCAVTARLNLHGRPNFVTSRHSDCFVFVLCGSCIYTFSDGSRHTVRGGDILYLAYGASYRMDIVTEYYDVIFCDFFFLSEHIRASAKFTPHSPAECEGIFRQLCKTYHKEDGASFQESLSLIYKIYGAASCAASVGYVESGVRRKIMQIKEYIDENYSDRTLGVSLLARRAGFSEVYLRRQFKAAIGLSPASYIKKVRIENAKRLMQYEPLGIEECASLCGFSSLQYFTRVFKSVCGMPPAKYRREAGAKFSV